MMGLASQKMILKGICYLVLRGLWGFFPVLFQYILHEDLACAGHYTECGGYDTEQDSCLHGDYIRETRKHCR